MVTFISPYTHFGKKPKHLDASQKWIKLQNTLMRNGELTHLVQWELPQPHQIFLFWAVNFQSGDSYHFSSQFSCSFLSNPYQSYCPQSAFSMVEFRAISKCGLAVWIGQGHQQLSFQHWTADGRKLLAESNFWLTLIERSSLSSTDKGKVQLKGKKPLNLTKWKTYTITLYSVVSLCCAVILC